MNKPITITSSIKQNDIIDVDRSLVQPGSTDQNVKSNNQVNKESGIKRQWEELDEDKSKRQNCEPIMITDDYFDYNQDLQEDFTYTIQSFYAPTTNRIKMVSILHQL
ncbi:unnamed protein product [Rotaria sp. Silwood1]|nr:unnamed protein product [Rotaria sp. Silwood1]CAF3758625.1 unnamed protein product [Rotaria sp. Silwood1]CAF3810492.1 unnamed protein product [Rotaria sp. Silwood1]CAF3841704.1 unnamed protein product [Rotaria sp. Silwood1]CAF3895141.1 unnamed protein product [Rotaria sp. Silwood1]